MNISDLKTQNIRNIYTTKYIFDVLNQLENNNMIPLDFTHSIRQYIFVDQMIPYENDLRPGIGNKFAFQEFINLNKLGYYISMDANNFKLINNINHIVGDNAIKSIGKALRNAATEIKLCKLFHSGGDEFTLFTEIRENVDIFISNAFSEIDKIEPVNNIHILTVSFGIDITYIDAENALLIAKKQKTDISCNLVFNNLI
jgi:GGDEF domain-containing protein